MSCLLKASAGLLLHCNLLAPSPNSARVNCSSSTDLRLSWRNSCKMRMTPISTCGARHVRHTLTTCEHSRCTLSGRKLQSFHCRRWCSGLNSVGIFLTFFFVPEPLRVPLAELDRRYAYHTAGKVYHGASADLCDTRVTALMGTTCTCQAVASHLLYEMPREW